MTAAADRLWAEVRAAHPGARAAIAADARAFRRWRGEGEGWRSPGHAIAVIARLALVSDAFAALALYRLKARLRARRVPLLPAIAHRLAIVLGGVCIGDPVVMEPGVYLLHGQVVIDGLVRIGAGTCIAPFTTIGLRAGNITGPRIGRDVQIGAGACVIGPVVVGDGSVIGAGAVVVDDVAAGATVVGSPARPTAARTSRAGAGT